MPKFSVSFPSLNGYVLDDFLQRIEDRKDYIDNVNVPSVTKSFVNDEYKEVILTFLNETKGTNLRRFISMEGALDYLFMNNIEINDLADSLSSIIEDYLIQGIFIANLSIAQILKKRFPDLLIIVSGDQLPFYTMQRLSSYKKLGINWIVPPRNSTRDLELMQMYKDNGFNICLTLNERCSLFCPHIGFCGTPFRKRTCLDPTHFLQRGYVIPRWLNILDDYCSMYRTRIKQVKMSILFKNLDAYIDREDCLLEDLFLDLSDIEYDGFNTSNIPDKLLTCHLECDKCNVCSSLYKKFPNLNNGQKTCQFV